MNTRGCVALLSLWMLASVPLFAAWGTGGATCQATSETASQTLACTLATENLEAGNVAVVACAADNETASDGATSDHDAVTDSGSNTYSKIHEFTEGSAGAAAGATVSLWFSKLTTQLTSASSTIICDFGASRTDRAMHLVKEFTIGAGNVVSVAGTPQGEASNGGDGGSLTISGLASGEYLFVRGIATESNAALSMTATTNYSLPGDPSDGCNNTTGGGEASDMGACGEYRILTGTGDTSNPTLVDTSNDNASVYAALQEAAPPGGNDWVATENFDSYTTGNNIDGGSGGSGWSGNWFINTGTITAETAPSGGQGGNAAHADASDKYIRTFTGISSGTLSIRMRISTTAPETDISGIVVREGVNFRFLVGFHPDGNIKIYDDGTTSYQTVLASYSANTWYTIEVEFNDSTQPDKYRARVDGGTWSSWYTAAGGYTSVDSLILFDGATNAHDMYWDDIKPGPSAPAAVSARRRAVVIQ